tara:strand:- start:3660 stop:4391 length:732 start_codon:yes stop_codon:yes gene_type:complete
VINKNNITQDLLETTERFYNSSMSIEERTAFENKLKSDDTFKSQVEDIKALLLGIETQSLKEQLDEFHKDIPLTISKNTSSRRKALQRIKYAVAAVVVIGLGSYWFFAKPSNEKLYAKYFVADPGLPTTMSKTENYEFFDAMVNYKRGEYKMAIAKWEKIQEEERDNDTINYFIGVSHLADKNIEKAIPFLRKVANKTEGQFNNDAYFYLGLAYLKINDREAAITFLKLNNSEKGKELLDKLE